MAIGWLINTKVSHYEWQNRKERRFDVRQVSLPQGGENATSDLAGNVWRVRGTQQR
jgi:hypothetical protein